MHGRGKKIFKRKGKESTAYAWPSSHFCSFLFPKNFELNGHYKLKANTAANTIKLISESEYLLLFTFSWHTAKFVLQLKNQLIQMKIHDGFLLLKCVTMLINDEISLNLSALCFTVFLETPH